MQHAWVFDRNLARNELTTLPREIAKLPELKVVFVNTTETMNARTDAVTA